LREAFSRIEETVNKLLSLGRPGEENRIGIRVNECVEKVLSLEESLLRKHRIRIAFQPDPSDPVALISSSGLGQILINLINNAVDAFEDASGIRNIRIAVSSPAPGTTLEIHFEERDPNSTRSIAHLFKRTHGTLSRLA
jgi:C4-dicarboxylate-specific signal transduction histidine kinase